MTALELHRHAFAILREVIGDRVEEVCVHAWTQAFGIEGKQTFEHTLSVTPADEIGFHFSTCNRGGTSFIQSSERCLEIFRTEVIPLLCQELCISGRAEYDPIAMGA